VKGTPSSLESSEPSIPSQSNQLFGIAADAPAVLSFPIVPDPALPVGTLVTFTARVSPLRTCGADLATLELDVLVEAP
jgi:hypothetical protein